jgi:hypothetical protein
VRFANSFHIAAYALNAAAAIASLATTSTAPAPRSVDHRGMAEGKGIFEMSARRKFCVYAHSASEREGGP